MRADLLGDGGYAGAVARLFDSVTPENELKWEVTESQPGHFDFASADRVVGFARRHGLSVRGHVLVWQNQLPAWVADGSLGRDALVAAMRRHIRALVGRYRGRIAEWDVVNEALAEDGGPRRTVFYDTIGPRYLEMAFRIAHRADPGARLVYNDYGVEGLGPKGDALFALVRRLVRDRVPIDAVGLQGHLTTAPVPGLAAQLRRLAALGVDVELTELDVRLPDAAGADALAAQAAAYARVVGACRAVARCRRVTFWGLDDADSFIDSAYPGYGRATLLDGDLRPKPAYRAVLAALRGR